MSKSHSLPSRPNLEFLKKLAKKHTAALRKTGKTTSLALSQLAIARRFGFPSWRKLKAHVDAQSPQPTAAALNPAETSQKIMNAIVARDNDTLRQLLEADPSAANRTRSHPNWGGRPQPLHVAIEVANAPAFKLLLDAGADADGNNETYGRWSPLMLAIHWNRSAMRDELIHRGARIDLIAALMLKDDRRVARILKNPASLNGPFPNQATPLHFTRTEKSARILISLGVNAAAKDQYGKTPVQLWSTVKPKSTGLMRLAKELGPLEGPTIVQAAEQRRLTVVRKMLRAGADVNSRSQIGSKGTLLHAAAWNGDLPMVRLLVAQGADIHAVDEEHKTTPIHWARFALKTFDRRPCAAVVDFLLKSES